MLSSNFTRFKYVDRGKKNTVALIPGWATDYRIFDGLDLEFNYILPLNFSPFVFEKGLIKTLGKLGIKKVSLFGYSLGGFVASEFCREHADIVDKLILVSVRRRYKIGQIKKAAEALNKNKAAYLYKFYKRCLGSAGKAGYLVEGIFKVYARKMDLGYLLGTLAYLSGSEIYPELIKEIDHVKIIHGEDDKIAPIEEIRRMKEGLPRAHFISVKGGGHMPFLTKSFKDVIS